MTARHPTRRDFLRGRPAGAPRSDLDEGVASPSLLTPRSSLLTTVRRRAMACDFEVQLPTARDEEAMEHALAALDLVEKLEDQMTVYRDDSEVIRMNRQAADGPAAVEWRLFALLKLAAELHDQTDGAVDITSGPLSDAWGFSRREGRLAGDEEIAAALACVGMHHVVLEDVEQTVAFDRPGVSINLNSIGKGYALDRMAELLDENGVGDYLLHGGRSSVLARGVHPGGGGPGWTIGLRHPLRPAERLAEFQLCNQSLATSGSATQFFFHRGRRYGHILDPRTGRPAEGIYSATAIAPTAAEADALSTAFYVMGPEKVRQFCTGRTDVAAVLVTPGQHEGEAELHVFGLSDDQWRRPSDR